MYHPGFHPHIKHNTYDDGRRIKEVPCFFFFVCDLEVITRKIASFKKILPSTETLLYVFKFMIKLVVASEAKCWCYFGLASKIIIIIMSFLLFLRLSWKSMLTWIRLSYWLDWILFAWFSCFKFIWSQKKIRPSSVTVKTSYCNKAGHQTSILW